jgi:hypothetical protein
MSLPATIATMSRSKTKQSKGAGAVDRARSLPWAALLQAAGVLYSRWRRLSDKDRARLMRMMRESQGRLTKLGVKERDELRGLVRKADLKGLAPELLALRKGGRRRRRH